MKYKINLDIREIEKKNYHVFVELRVNDIPCRLLLDTGASKTVFDAEKILLFVEEKNIKIHESLSIGLGTDQMETKVVKLKNVVLNKFHKHKMEVAVLPLSHVNTSYQNMQIPEIDGVLGSDFLMKYKAIIDYKKHRLTLEK